MKKDKTAIKRTTPSKPIRVLSDLGLLIGKKLDYGSGKGKDAEVFNMDQYDPCYFPAEPTRKYKTITCTYVLNVIETTEEIHQVLNRIEDLLEVGGKAYITVRRDLTEGQSGTYSSRGTFQSNVYTNLPILKEKKNAYCIYVMEKK